MTDRLPAKTAALIVILGLAGCAKHSHHYTIPEVDAALRAGKVNPGMVSRLAGQPPPVVRDVSVSGLPLQLFAFDDRDSTHILLVDGWDLVLLYSGPKSLVPYDFHLAKENSEWVLTFKFNIYTMSGKTALPGRYVLTNPPAG